MSHIVTFYSFKGGVGRTMALANVACLLAAKGQRVLMVDWDLEAPGLHRYFANCRQEATKTPGGTIALLEAMKAGHHDDSSAFETIVNIGPTEFYSGARVTMLASGMGAPDYQKRVLGFDLGEFYAGEGALRLEKLRASWRERFDCVLIDSRTGITDAGGICTILLPDTLVLVFTANEQSLSGSIDVAHRAERGRQGLNFDRRGLTVLPIPSRFDSRVEQEVSELWMGRFVTEVEPFMDSWRPIDIDARRVLERIKIPHVAFFSFGEKLAAVTHSLTDPDKPGFYYANIMTLIAGRFSAEAVAEVCSAAPRPSVKTDELSFVDQYDVVVHASERDSHVGRKMAEELAAIGMRVFYDRRDIAVGAQFEDAIRRAALRTKLFVVLLSSGMPEDAAWRITRVAGALGREQRTIPILLRGATINDIPLGLRQVQAIDLNATSDADTIRLIANAIEHKSEESGELRIISDRCYAASIALCLTALVLVVVAALSPVAVHHVVLAAGALVAIAALHCMSRGGAILHKLIYE